MKSPFEKGALARHRENRGEGEVGRVVDRVNEFDDRMTSDLASFPVSDEVELQQIRKEAEELTARTRGSLGSKMKEWAKKHTILKMAVASVGLHAVVLSPQFLNAVKEGREALAQLEKDWFSEGKIVHLQTDEQKAEVKRKIAERESRIDPAARAAYKKDLFERLERGEEVTFEELNFGLEEKNGVLPEEIEAGKEKARQLVEKLSSDIGDTLEDEEIKSVVNELYGDPDNHVDAQASMTEYFLTGKHNCVAFDRGEQVVWEGILSRLPETERTKWSIGDMFVKQHRVATLTWRDGSDERMFILEPGREPTVAHPMTGTVKVDAAIVKKTAVSEKPVQIRATEGDVPPSPDLDFISNQPFDSGFVISGDLASSDFNREEVERRGLKIESATVDAMEVEIEGDPKMRVLESESKRLSYSTVIRTQELSNPTPEMVDLFVSNGARSIKEVEKADVIFDKLPQWSVESIQHLLRIKHNGVVFQGIVNLNLRKALSIYEGVGIHLPTEEFEQNTVAVGPAPGLLGVFEELTPEQISDFFAVFPRSEISFYGEAGSIPIDESAFHSMRKARVKSLSFHVVPSIRRRNEKPMSPPAVWHVLSAFASPVVLGAEAYFRGVVDHPEYWEYANISPDIEGADATTLVALMQFSRKEPMTKRQMEIFGRIEVKVKESLDQLQTQFKQAPN